MTKHIAEACRSCRFWKIDPATSTADKGAEIQPDDVAFGFCRRNAPVVIGELAALCVPKQVWGRDAPDEEEIWTTQLARCSTFPVSENDDWCGKYEFAQPAVSL